LLLFTSKDRCFICRKLYLCNKYNLSLPRTQLLIYNTINNKSKWVLYLDRHIKYKAFVETVKCGSLTAAANILNYTQPGISRIITSMEDDFGFRLFNRSKSGVTLTEEGKRIYEICLGLLEQENLLDQTIGQINGSLIGTIRVGAYYSVLINWMPEIMETMHSKYPEIEFQILEGNAEEQISMLKKNTIDIGILSSSAPDEFDFIPLYSDPFVIIMSKDHPLAEHDIVEPSEIAKYRVLQKPEHWSSQLKVLLGQNKDLQSNYTARSDNALLGLANKGLGIGIVGEMVANSGVGVEYRHIKNDYYRTIGLAIPAWKPVTPALQCLIDVIIDLYQSGSFKNNGKAATK